MKITATKSLPAFSIAPAMIEHVLFTMNGKSNSENPKTSTKTGEGSHPVAIAL